MSRARGRRRPAAEGANDVEPPVVADPGPAADPPVAPFAAPLSDEVVRTASYALVLVLALLTALWGAFLVPLRVLGVPVPVSLVVACVANAVLGTVGGRLHGRLGAALPGLVWFTVVALLQSRRPEGDLVVTGSLTGLLFLLLGSLAAAVPVGMARSRPKP